jgi:hypothetical protein
VSAYERGKRVIRTAGGEDVLVAIVPASFDDLACVRFILLDSGICQHADIVVNIKIEQRT